MGQRQSIPTHLMQPPRYDLECVRRNQERPGGFMNLHWRLTGTGVTIRLDVDVALCFGDVCRVLQVLAADDAELDADPATRPLLPVQHKRLRFVNGMLPDEQSKQACVAFFAGMLADSNRQICERSGLRKGSTIDVVVPRQSLWLALPRPPEGISSGGFLRSPWRWLSSWWEASLDWYGWALPAGWDRGLQEIERNQRMRLIDRREGAGAGQEATQDGSGSAGLIDALLANVTDHIDDPPLDVYVGVRPPESATLYVDATTTRSAEVELVIHMQLPPTFPLSSERCRMLTPVLHPLVEPPWDDESGVGQPFGGRMARPPSATPAKGKQTTFLFEFCEALIEPVACAARMVCLRPADADARVRRWAANANGEMEDKARRLASERGRIRWRPELHVVCPRAFQAEVRTLLLVLQRIGGERYHSRTKDDEEEVEKVEPIKSLPCEVVWLVIDALLERHLSSGSLLFS